MSGLKLYPNGLLSKSKLKHYFGQFNLLAEKDGFLSLLKVIVRFA